MLNLAIKTLTEDIVKAKEGKRYTLFGDERPPKVIVEIEPIPISIEFAEYILSSLVELKGLRQKNVEKEQPCTIATIRERYP